MVGQHLTKLPTWKWPISYMYIQKLCRVWSNINDFNETESPCFQFGCCLMKTSTATERRRGKFRIGSEIQFVDPVCRVQPSIHLCTGGSQETCQLQGLHRWIFWQKDVSKLQCSTFCSFKFFASFGHEILPYHWLFKCKSKFGNYDIFQRWKKYKCTLCFVTTLLIFSR